MQDVVLQVGASSPRNGSKSSVESERGVGQFPVRGHQVKAFAGSEYEKARYYGEEKKFLLRLDPHVTHYEVLVGSLR